MLRVTSLQKSLEEYLSLPVILADQSASKPPYPYLTLKVIVDNIPNGHHPFITNEEIGDVLSQIATSHYSMSISVTAYGKEFDDVTTLIKKSHDWFSFVGKRSLKSKNMVVASVEAIQNRDSLIVDDYERRRGFDVMIRYMNVSSRFTEKLESVSLLVNRIKE